MQSGFQASSRPSIYQMFDYKKDNDMLDALLLVDLFESAKQGKLHLTLNHVTKVYLKEIEDLITKYKLEQHQAKLLAAANEKLMQSIGVATICFPTQQKLENYDKWCQQQEGGQYQFGYYLSYAYDSIQQGISGESAYNPPLMMQNFKEELAGIKEQKAELAQSPSKPSPS